MNILIIGAGEVGSHLANLLSRENHNITIVDNDPEKVARISETLDVLAIEGLGTSPSTLKEAGIEHSDMVIAVTTVDEVNVLACMVAKHFGVKTKIARVRNREFTRHSGFLDPAELGIDLVIHPELEATREIVRLVRFPNAIEMITFCEGKIAVVGTKVQENAPAAGKQLHELGGGDGDRLLFRVIAISRDGATLIPRGQDRIESGDELYVTCHTEDLKQVFALAGHEQRETHYVMLYGATAIGRMVAEELEQDRDLHIKLIEGDPERGKEVAEDLDNVQVVLGDASDIDLITREGIIDQDVFAALSNDDENNIVTSLLARHLRVPKTITLIGKSDYAPIVKTIGLDVAINPRLLTSNAILKYIRHGEIVSLRHMAGVNAETYEFQVSATSKVVGKKIRDISFPKDSIVVAVAHRDGPEIPVGDTKIYVGDKVVIFCLPDAVGPILKLFE